ALELGLRVIGTFIICSFVGVKLDQYFHSQPIILLICLLLAFVYVIRLLLGVGKHE
ncbi:MAG: AtpZ/AtpI family protein, partial [Coprobacillus cateniformis]